MSTLQLRQISPDETWIITVEQHICLHQRINYLCPDPEVPDNSDLTCVLRSSSPSGCVRLRADGAALQKSSSISWAGNCQRTLARFRWRPTSIMKKRRSHFLARCSGEALENRPLRSADPSEPHQAGPRHKPMARPFTITTAISYPNGRPHIGHAYEAIATDAIARAARMMGRDVFFQTGTDEHGLKMAQTARARDNRHRARGRNVVLFQAKWMMLLASATTASSAQRSSNTIRPARRSGRPWPMPAISTLAATKAGIRCVTKPIMATSEIVDGEGGEKLSPQGTPVEWTIEESWFFRLSNYQEPLLKLYADHPEFIQPESRRNEVLRFVESGLRISRVSRSTFDWGVKVPGAPDHVMYVWVDALTNYITGCGYPDDQERMAHYWPNGGDIVHIIGKDIVRFHAVYWPAFLMSAGLPLPKTVFGHGFLLNRGAKMSKSLGNVVDPLDWAERFGVDQLRYFLLAEVSFGNDGSYSTEALVQRANTELGNSFGNLAQRTLSFIAKNLDGRLPARSHSADDEVLLDMVCQAAGTDMPRGVRATSRRKTRSRPG